MGNAAQFRRQLLAFAAASLGPEARAAKLAAFARSHRDGLIAAGQASPTYRTIVDGRTDASEDAVRGDGSGRIVYEFSYTADAAVHALAFLKRRVRSRDGDFVRNFFVVVNGIFFKADSFDPVRVPANAEIIIGNTEPYNRLIDVQRAGGREVRFRTAANMYDAAARSVSRRFGNSVRAWRNYDIDFPGKYRLVNAQRRKIGRDAGRVIRPAGGKVQSPGLIISAR